MPLGMKRGAVAIPLVSVRTAADGAGPMAPRNEPLGPEVGAEKVTRTPGMGLLLESVTWAWSGRPLARAVIAAGGPFSMTVSIVEV